MTSDVRTNELEARINEQDRHIKKLEKAGSGAKSVMAIVALASAVGGALVASAGAYIKFNDEIRNWSSIKSAHHREVGGRNIYDHNKYTEKSQLSLYALKEEFVSKTELETALGALASPSELIPSGAVMAFLSGDTRPCPGSEWEVYDDAKGRFIVGAGQSKNKELTPRLAEDTGGSEAHILTLDEMPAHDHGGVWGGTKTKAGMNNDWAYHSSGYKQMQTEGKGKPHNNLPPFLALYYCKKA